MHKKPQNRPVAKNHAKIVLTGNFNIKSNIPFEVYRQAIKCDVTGYIKFQENDKSEIVAEAESKAIETFVHWLLLFVQMPGISMNVNWSDTLSNYNEFRIIH